MKIFTIKIIVLLASQIIMPNCFAQAPVVGNGIGPGNCLSFNGTTNWIDNIGNTGTYSFIQNTGVFTIEAWVRFVAPFSDWSNAIVANTPTTGEKGFMLRYYSSTTQLDLQIFKGVGGTTVNYSDVTVSQLSDQLWHHVAVTGNGSSVIFYVDGTAYAGNAFTGGFSSGNSSRVLRIGDDYNSSPPFNSTPGSPNGQLDEIRIWNRTLSQTEIRNAMCKKLKGTESGLVGYWRMDEGTGTTTNDATANGNTGTLH